jgi:hypothetical protein
MIQQRRRPAPLGAISNGTLPKPSNVPTRFRSYRAVPFVCVASCKDLAPTEPLPLQLAGQQKY